MLRVGPKGFGMLTNIVNNPADPTRNTVIWTIGEYRGGDQKTITRILVSVLNDRIGQTGAMRPDSWQGGTPNWRCRRSFRCWTTTRKTTTR